jgi:predicted RNA binding protein YcfA (HicA-like mRNA interferase family)
MWRRNPVPVKIRKLKSELSKAGFYSRSARGSHTRWYYQHDTSIFVTLSGNDGDDADAYQIKDVRNALRKADALKKAKEL